MFSPDARFILGLVWSVAFCGLTLRVGEVAERRVALVMMMGWVATTTLQFLVPNPYTVAVIAQCCVGATLLWFAARYNKLWIWTLIAGAAALMLVHAIFYHPPAAPSAAYILATDVFVWGAPSFVAVVALFHRVRRAMPVRSEPPQPAQPILTS